MAPEAVSGYNFGQVLSRAKREGGVFITRYDRPVAVMLSIEEYEALTGDETIDLATLEREFHDLRWTRSRAGRTDSGGVA